MSRTVQYAPQMAFSASSSAITTAVTVCTVRQTALGSGTLVREYVSQDGTVFGAGWSGPRMPDLAELLGSYFPQYVVGVNAARDARRPWSGV